MSRYNQQDPACHAVLRAQLARIAHVPRLAKFHSKAKNGWLQSAACCLVMLGRTCSGVLVYHDATKAASFHWKMDLSARVIQDMYG